ncbi:MAG: RnfABCDGE type electron transport complex subunit G [Bacteroidota bacterium]|nr:RnfABCDGE type electron transport complex subunit G [Bacteroidota bacterium]
MKKWDASLTHMILSMGLISVIAAGALGLVHTLTAEPIRLADQAKQEAAIREVTPAFDNNPLKECFNIRTEKGDSLMCFPARKGGKLVGVAIETYSMKGFGGEIRLMVGLSPEGDIHNYTVLKHSETPGLGSKMAEWFKTAKNKQSILGLNPGKDKVLVSKDGGEVDAITAATISSRAFLDAINRAYIAYVTSTNSQNSKQVVYEKH